jgi:hypothetical protein
MQKQILAGFLLKDFLESDAISLDVSGWNISNSI